MGTETQATENSAPIGVEEKLEPAASTPRF